jgi:hypothetical protein
MKKQTIYLVAHYTTKPRDPRKTHIPGYMKDPANHQYDEQVAIQTRLKPNDVNAKIVMNLGEKKVESNKFNDNRDFNELFKYFFKGYHKYVTEIMSKLDPVYFDKMLDEMKAEHEAEKANEEAPAQ